MTGDTVLYKGIKAFIMSDRKYRSVGRMLSIQILDKTGKPFSIKDRPNEFRVRFFVRPDEVTAVVDS